MNDPIKPRKTPCASCPYRRNVASGIWAAEEYDKLPDYDAVNMVEQPMGVFMCHQQDGCACSGWLGYHDPTEMLAVRIALSTGALDPSCADYTTTVPLFSSGAEAAEHGKRDIAHPGTKAERAIDKLVTNRELRGEKK